MSLCGCPCCTCECEECGGPPMTAEELEEANARATERAAELLSLRMTPAQNSIEQVDRDIDAAMDSLARRIAEEFYR